MSAQVSHESPTEVLENLIGIAPWKHKAAPPKRKRRRRQPPAWALALQKDRDANVVLDPPVPCPSCGGMFCALDGSRGEIDDGALVDVIQCPVCRAMIVLDLRSGTFRAPTSAERKIWRLTFWFSVMRDSEGD